MDHIPGLFIHLLPSVGFILALILLSHILKQRRSPTSTLAWLMAVVFIPYVGVPLYILLGGRKISRRVASKHLIQGQYPVQPIDDTLEHQLASMVFRSGFPPTRRNRVTLLKTGEKCYRETIRLIEGAERSLHIATFILGKDETGKSIVDALARKAAQGVEVFLLLDALGSVKINRRFLARLHRSGGRTAFFMPMLHLPFRGRANLRNHRKMLIADGAAAIVGGMNLGNEYMGAYAVPHRWQDLSVRIVGPAVEHAFEIFRSDWAFAAQEDIELPPSSGARIDETASTALQFIASGPDVENDMLREALITSLFRAHHRVWIVTPYFVPDDLLLDALCMTAKRGVDLCLMIPRRSNHRLADLAREGYLSQLQEAGARILLYRRNMLHAKAMLIDETVAVTGSANMDMRSLLLNYEVALCVYSADVIRELDNWMIGLMAHCRERKQKTSESLALIEGVSRLFAPLL
ncbi:MAG: cardiolipin synthase [Desulfobacterales bacterium]